MTNTIPIQEVLLAQQKTAEQIAAMSPAERKDYDDLQRRIVFGNDSKVDDEGRPIECGLGSASQPTRNSIEAFKRWHGSKSAEPDQNFEESLARMEAEYAAYVAAKKSAKAKRLGHGA
jgi:hypothetical protein